jgi:hypothetical protein
MAQKSYIGGYVVTLSGDTLRGLVRLFSPQSSRLQMCYFQKSYTDTPTIYVPTDVAGYGYENGRSLISVSYLSDTLGTAKQVFMEYIITGKLSLLRLKNDYFLYKSNKLYPLLIETKEVRGIDRNYVKTTLLYQDVIHGLVKPECPDIIYQGQQIKEKELIRVVKAYNQCAESTYEVNIPSEKHRNSLHFYLQGGYQQMNMQLPSYGQQIDPSGVLYNVVRINTTVPVNNRFFLPTIGIEWFLSRLSNKIALTAELSQFKINNTLHFRFDNYNYQQDFADGSLLHEYRLLGFSPAVKYYFTYDSYRPYLQVGLTFYTVQNEKSHLSVRSEVATSPISTQKTVQFFNREEAINIAKKPLGFLVVLGIDIPVFQKLKAFAVIKAENTNMSYQSYSFSMDYNTANYNNSLLAISTHIGVRF